jgi:HD-GYP domain-containing protein (c-di-GMP phosphodiesterase class II)
MLDNQVQTKAIEKIVDQAVKVSRKLGLSEREVKVIQYVAAIHDIGMTKISDDILNKTFDLSPEELKEIQSHTQRGAELIRPLEFMEAVSNIILYHHERVDGLGYPMGLKGDQIPTGSRILAIIDAFQSMTSEKPYRPELSRDEALEELVECAGKQFDARIVECFVEVLGDDGKILSKRLKELKKALRGAMQSTY